MLGRESFINEEDSQNPYGFLREGIHSEDNIRSERLEDDNFPIFPHRQHSNFEIMDPNSEKKEGNGKSHRNSSNLELAVKSEKEPEIPQMYPHDSIQFEKESDFNLQIPSPVPQIRTHEILQNTSKNLEKKVYIEEVESQGKSGVDEKDENR